MSELGFNLLSASQISKATEMSVIFHPGKELIKQENGPYLFNRTDSGLYVMKFECAQRMEQLLLSQLHSSAI